jgi:beta-glucosidase
LRKQWGFKGFIVTDCGAVDDFFKKETHQVVVTAEEAAALAIKSGVDLECGNIFNAIDLAIDKKLLTEAELDVALKRLFTARFKLGLFDEKSKNAYNAIPYSVVECKKNQQLALEVAKKSIVLLKNEHHALPLHKNIKTLAVIGPNANDDETVLANYHGFSSNTVTPLQGIKNKVPNTNVLYARGCSFAEGLPVLDVIPAAHFFTTLSKTTRGLKASYFNNEAFSGEPIITRIDSSINFNWIEKLPSNQLNPFNFSVVWEGYFDAPETGEYTLDIYGSTAFELFVNDKKVFDYKSQHEPGHQYARLKFNKNDANLIKIKYKNTGSNPLIKFNWQLPSLKLEAEALQIAKKADAVVLCMGLSPRIEGEEMNIKLDGFEGGDRVKLALPVVQQNLIKSIVALGKPVVLVLLNGSAVAINWEKENVPAIVESWYGGQAAGTAIADVLFGDYNPSGKLPVTFYSSESDLPAFDDYNMKGRTYRYFKGKPLFPFGFGLSYTTFHYSNLSINKQKVGGKYVYKVGVSIKNTGKFDGEEIVQLYIKSKENKSIFLH